MIRLTFLLIVAAAALAPVTAFALDVAISNAADLAKLSAATPGTTYILADGTYQSGNISCSANGTAAAPIVVRAEHLKGAKIVFSGGVVEGFKVSGAHWHFEGLEVSGACPNDSDCEHAFHVTGAAVGFVLRDCKISDFNAELKVNSAQVAGVMTTPHNGLVEANDVGDTHGRKTSNPVTKLNIDTGDDWIVRDNIVHDAFKDGGDGVSYAVFMKSGGSRGLIENNLIICARDIATGGTRIGLSFGGGGTGNPYCAPAFDASVPCAIEHSDGVMRNNIIANCSDVGIYLNKAKNTSVIYNTLVATSGIDFRFAATTGQATGNLLEGKIRARDGGTFKDGGNVIINSNFFKSTYKAPLLGDLSLLGPAPAGVLDQGPLPGPERDYCGRLRVDGKPDFGALEHSLGNCATLAGGDQQVSAPATADSDGIVESTIDAGGSPDASAVDVSGSIDAVLSDSGAAAAAAATSAPTGCAAQSAGQLEGSLLVSFLFVLAFYARRAQRKAISN